MLTTEEQKLAQSLLISTQLMIANGLDNWTVKLHTRRTVLADCYYSQRAIRYSRYFLTVATKEQIEGVTLHEIAHALVGTGHGHDRKWREKSLEIGSGTVYAKSKVNIPVHKYKLTCPECGKESGANRMRRGYYCNSCWRSTKKMVSLKGSINELKLVTL